MSTSETERDRVEAMDNLAIKKAGSIPTWRPYLYDKTRTGLAVTGCRTGVYSRGPRKGECKYLIKEDNITVHMLPDELDREATRAAFEADAGPYDFDLTRTPGEPLSPEPWAEYVDEATGHRWAGWLARTGDA